MIYDDLLSFETNKDLLDFRFNHDDILMWPFVRSALFLKVVDEEFQHKGIIPEMNAKNVLKLGQNQMNHRRISSFEKGATSFEIYRERVLSRAFG